MATNSFTVFCRMTIVVAALSGAVPQHLAAQQCSGGGWSAPADVLGPNGRRVMMDPTSVLALRDTVHAVGGIAIEWSSDTAVAPTPVDSAFTQRIRRMFGFRIDARNRAIPTERVVPGAPATRPVIAVGHDGALGVVWSTREPRDLGNPRDSVGRLHTMSYRSGAWANEQKILPEMARDLSFNAAVTVAGAAGGRVIVVDDAYPRFGGRSNEILLAHESNSGWFHRRYLTQPSQRGEASVARLEPSGDIVLLGVVNSPQLDGFRVRGWRISSDSVRESVLPYALGAGTELANIGNSYKGFPRLFAIGGDSVIAIWSEDAETAVISNGTAFDRAAMRATILVATLSANGGRTWLEVLRRRVEGGVSRPVILRDGRGGINLFYDTRVTNSATGTLHLVWRDGNWQTISNTFDALNISSVTMAATPTGLVALWATGDASLATTMRLKHPWLRIARYDAPRCH